MNSKIGITSILTALALAATLATGLIIPAYAGGPNNPTADENVHENTPGEFGGDQDIRYHEGTCQGGSDSEACDFEIITEPGNSDENRRDN